MSHLVMIPIPVPHRQYQVAALELHREHIIRMGNIVEPIGNVAHPIHLVIILMLAQNDQHRQVHFTTFI